LNQKAKIFPRLFSSRQPKAFEERGRSQKDSFASNDSPAIADFLCVPDFRAERQIESHNTIVWLKIFHIVEFIRIFVQEYRLHSSRPKIDAGQAQRCQHHLVQAG
jgi:hypothetical protein